MRRGLHGFMQSEHLLEVVVLYVGDAAPCLCKQNSCHDLFLYFSIQAEPRKMLGGGPFVVMFCSYH